MKILTLVERRADYSRIRPILREMYKDSFFEIYLVVTGACLLDTHGKDIDHRDRNPNNNSLTNLSVKSKSKNRSRNA